MFQAPSWSGTDQFLLIALHFKIGRNASTSKLKILSSEMSAAPLKEQQLQIVPSLQHLDGCPKQHLVSKQLSCNLHLKILSSYRTDRGSVSISFDQAVSRTGSSSFEKGSVFQFPFQCQSFKTFSRTVWRLSPQNCRKMWLRKHVSKFQVAAAGTRVPSK